MTCSNCGKENAGGAAFCAGCGAKLAAPARRKKTLPVIAAALVLAAALILSAVLLISPGSKTVYLLTEHEIRYEGMKITARYEYDDRGRLISFDRTLNYPDQDHPFDDLCLHWEYAYDEEGRIEEAKYEYDSLSFRLEYLYDSDGYLKGIESRDFEGDVDCDREGRVISFELTETPDTQISAEFSYFDSGALEEMEYTLNGDKTTYRYDEAGRLLEQKYYRDTELWQSYLYEYDEAGRPLSERNTIYSGGDIFNDTRYSYGYDKDGNWVSYTVEADDYSDGTALTVECEVEGDADSRKVVIAGITGDRETVTADFRLYDLEEGDTLMKERCDERGICIQRTTYNGGTVKEVFEYEPFEVSRDFLPKLPTSADYFWYLSTYPSLILS